MASMQSIVSTGCECGSCGIKDFEYEPALLPDLQQVVQWAKNKKIKRTGGATEHGTDGCECKPCEQTRNGSFAGMLQRDLNKIKAESEEARAKQAELRTINARGENIAPGKKVAKHEKVSMEQFVKKSSETFRSSFKELDQYTLEGYFRDHIPAMQDQLTSDKLRKNWLAKHRPSLKVEMDMETMQPCIYHDPDN
jgi:hypothetical protein